MFEGLASLHSLLTQAMKHFPIDEGYWEKHNIFSTVKLLTEKNQIFFPEYV